MTNPNSDKDIETDVAQAEAQSADPQPPLVVPKEIDLDDPALFFNRELSLLRFQERVLAEARDVQTPLLERVKFLGIVFSNLDEFFMVRVAGLRQLAKAGVLEFSADGQTPAEQLASIRRQAQSLLYAATEYFHDILVPELKTEGVHMLAYENLTDRQRSFADNYFDEYIFPVLTPLAVDPGRPFPHISSLSLNVAVEVKTATNEISFARIKVPNSLPRFIPLKRSSGGVRKDGTVPHNHYFVWIEQLIIANLDKLFPGMDIVSAHVFRVVRDAEMAIKELEADDLLATMEMGVRRRRFGSVVSLTIASDMPKNIREFLLGKLALSHNEVYEFDGAIGLSSLIGLNIDRYQLKYRPYTPIVPDTLVDDLKQGNIFDAIQRGDILLHQPYHSFTPVVNMLEAAAVDPNVLAIKQTLYRVGRNSPVVEALLKARRNGKQVAVLVELKARFDEESNISWARALEREGVHVIYGLLGLKVHSKLALVVRRESEGIRRYVHISTGNYNAVTANFYEDVGLFTCDPDVGADVSDVFNYITGYSAITQYRKLLVAPVNLRDSLVELIEREIQHQQNGLGGRIIFKCNALVDKAMIKMLYRASMAGVEIDLIVRGICSLRPGLKGISENITVRSVVGRFLEHSRVYYFENAGEPDMYLGSADLMPRNLDRRVETLVPVTDQRLQQALRFDILEQYLKDTERAREMQPDGTYMRVRTKTHAEKLDVQSYFIE